MFHCICNAPASYHIYTNRSALNLGGKKEKKEKKAFFTAPGPQTGYLAVPGWFGLVFSFAAWIQWPSVCDALKGTLHPSPGKILQGQEQFIKSFSTKAQ